MGYSVAVQNAMLDLLDESGTLPATHLSLHTADPGDTGASEVAGGSYVREAITWAAASAGAKAINESPVFQVPAATTITHFGLWSAVSGGTFRGGGALPSSEAFGGPGTYTANSLTIDV
jgi:hypothetical protein